MIGIFIRVTDVMKKLRKDSLRFYIFVMNLTTKILLTIYLRESFSQEKEDTIIVYQKEWKITIPTILLKTLIKRLKRLLKMVRCIICNVCLLR